MNKIITKESGVYCITNKINNKFYIGSTVNFKQRWRDHKKLLNSGKHFNIYLQNAVNKYSLDNFEFKILFICNSSEAKDLEQLLFDNNLGDYNLDKTVVKSGFKSKNRKFSNEDIQKIRWLYNEGYLPKDISKLFKTNNNTLNSITKNYYYTDVEGLKECPELTDKLRKRQTYKSSKILEKDVFNILNLKKEGLLNTEIAKRYNMTPQAIGKILNKKSYSYLHTT